MSDQPYKRPPITEAVIEVKFETGLSADDIERVCKDFATSYPGSEITKNVDVEVGIRRVFGDQPVAQFSNIQVGYRRSSNDLTEIIILWPNSFLISQLAPYHGWDVFFGRFYRDWRLWQQAIGYRKIIRIGVRFINRIDIAIIKGFIDQSQYLNVFPIIPETLGSMTENGVQVRLPLPDIQCNLTINSGSVRSPLLGHGSFLLDIDIAMESKPPQKESEIYEALDRIRTKKNVVFEACITDKARELFQL